MPFCMETSPYCQITIPSPEYICVAALLLGQCLSGSTSAHHPFPKYICISVLQPASFLSDHLVNAFLQHLSMLWAPPPFSKHICLAALILSIGSLCQCLSGSTSSTHIRVAALLLSVSSLSQCLSVSTSPCCSWLLPPPPLLYTYLCGSFSPFYRFTQSMPFWQHFSFLLATSPFSKHTVYVCQLFSFLSVHLVCLSGCTSPCCQLTIPSLNTHCISVSQLFSFLSVQLVNAFLVALLLSVSSFSLLYTNLCSSSSPFCQLTQSMPFWQHFSFLLATPPFSKHTVQCMCVSSSPFCQFTQYVFLDALLHAVSSPSLP